MPGAGAIHPISGAAWLTLLLQLLQPLHLVQLQTAVLVAPAVIRDLADPDPADCLRQRRALHHRHVHLPQLGDDLLGLVLLSRH